MSRTVLFKLQCVDESPKDLVEMQILSQWDWGRALKSCVSDKLPGDTDADGPWTTL